MIVFALTKIPKSLRGDLTKWCQELQTGIYVGNFNAKIRDLLWQRINKNIGAGEATMVYTTNNELGYTFLTTRSDKKVVDFDGVPLLKHLTVVPKQRPGFSKAAKFYRAKVAQERKTLHVVSLDIETTGLNLKDSQIISIGAVKTGNGQSSFYRLIKIDDPLPEKIKKLTNLSDDELAQKGVSLREALIDLIAFIKNAVVIGYNLNFDISFLNQACRANRLDPISAKLIDVLNLIKRKDRFLDNYHLETVLEKYGIQNEQAHNSLADATATLELYKKIKNDN